MKRISIFIIIILLANTAFSQPYGGLLSGVDSKPAYEFRSSAFSWTMKNGVTEYNLTPQRFKVMLGNEQFLKVIDKETYSFFNEGKFYMLSYDQDTMDIPNLNWHDNMKIERGLFLFRLDEDRWTRASDKPVQIDFKEIKDLKKYYCAYFPWRYNVDFEMKGEVKKLANGDIHLRIINHKMNDYGNPTSRIEYFYTEVILIPKGDGTYRVQ